MDLRWGEWTSGGDQRGTVGSSQVIEGLEGGEVDFIVNMEFAVAVIELGYNKHLVIISE